MLFVIEIESANPVIAITRRGGYLSGAALRPIELLKNEYRH